MKSDATLGQLLKSFGLSDESVERIRLGRGVVGRTTYAAVVALFVLAVVAWRAEPSMLIWIAVLAVVVFVSYFLGVLIFAERNPGTALLLRWRQSELAAKGLDSIPPVPALPEPTDTQEAGGRDKNA